MLIILWGISPVTLGACLRFLQLTQQLKIYQDAELLFIYEQPYQNDLFICRFEYLEQALRGVDEERVKNGDCWSYLFRFVPGNFLLYDKPVEVYERELILTSGKRIKYDYLITGIFLRMLGEFFSLPYKGLQMIEGSKICRNLNMPSGGEFEMNDLYIALRRGHREIIYNLHEKLPNTEIFNTPVQNENSRSLVNKLEEKFAVLARGRLGGWKQCLADEEFMHGVEAMDFALSGKGEEIFFSSPLINGMERSLSISLDWLEDEIEFVIASYNETWEWVRYLPGKVTLYHKGFVETPSENFRGSWIKLENVGMEAHTYLTHIVENYNKLAPITAFFLGKIKKHQENGWIFVDLCQYKRALKDGLVVRQILQNIDWSEFAMFNKEQLEDFHGGIISPSQHGDTLREYWQYIMEEEPPVACQYSRFPVFSVRRDIIQRRPLHFYQKLLDTVSLTRCPQETYFLRAMWLHIFS